MYMRVQGAVVTVLQLQGGASVLLLYLCVDQTAFAHGRNATSASGIREHT